MLPIGLGRSQTLVSSSVYNIREENRTRLSLKVFFQAFIFCNSVISVNGIKLIPRALGGEKSTEGIE